METGGSSTECTDMWITIALAFLKVVGPLLVEWFMNWLATRMQEAATRLPPPESFGSEQERHLALLDEVYDSTPWFRPRNKRAVAKLREKVARYADLASIPSDEMGEVMAELAA